MDDEQRDFFRNLKPPSAEQLALNAHEIGRLGKEVERISMDNYSNNAHASVDALALVWGLITIILGMTQTQLLPGSAHWVIRALHLVVGLVAMGLGETLAARGKRLQMATAQQ